MIASRRSPPAQTCARNRMDVRFGLGEETPKRTLRARAIDPGSECLVAMKRNEQGGHKDCAPRPCLE